MRRDYWIVVMFVCAVALGIVIGHLTQPRAARAARAAVAWESLDGGAYQDLRRTPVPGGWLVYGSLDCRVTYVPDEHHAWTVERAR